MSVPAQVPVTLHTGNGVTTVFAYQFLLTLAGDLVVTVGDVVKTLNVDYTISGLGVQAGGDVTFISGAPASGASIILQRVIALVRATDYQYAGDFQSTVVNPDFDRLWMAAQGLKEELGRSIRVAPDSSGVDLELPAPVPLTYLRWNTLANALESVLLADISLISLTTYAQTLLNAIDAAAARLILAVAPRATRIDVASVAGTVDLTANAPNTDDIRMTGTHAIAGVTIEVGRVVRVLAAAGHSLVNGANLVTQTGANIVCQPGDTYSFRATAANVVEVLNFTRATPTSKIELIDATVAANALTVTINPTSLDFRSATLTSGAVNTRSIPAAISCVVPSGATLGGVNAIAARIAVLAIDNAGTVEVAVVNLAGGTNLDEAGVISTTALSAAADAANVIYSTTARTNVPYRVQGFVDFTQAVAGTYATQPSKIQGAGGQALAAMSSLGFGQTWQDVSVSRAIGTTYYNTTGKPIKLAVTGQQAAANDNANLVINGVVVMNTGQYGGGVTAISSVTQLIPAGASYAMVNNTGSWAKITWTELR